MLTKSDLSQIRKVVREEVETEVKDSTRTLDSQVRMSRMHIQQDISELDDRMKNVEIRMERMHNELKEEIKMVSHTLDKDNTKTLKRVEKTEDHLGITAS